MPDEQSNLNQPAPARRPINRRRGRRGGRGRSRGPRPAPQNPEAPMTEEIPSSPKSVEPSTAPVDSPEQIEHEEHEVDTSGGFREPHPEVPAEFASHDADPVETTDPEPAVEAPPAPEPVRAPAPPREQRREPRPERRPEPPPRQKQWVKPADFRPAAPTAIAQAVEHATFIAEALKELHDQLDEVLELVEVAERQKLADEREIEELRRALRRIQPSRRDPQPPHQVQQRQQPRREEPRRQAPQQREQPERREPAEPQAETPPPPPPEVEETPHTD